MESLERTVDALGLSSLVVTIGGIATYPAMLPLQGTPVQMLEAIAHEWIHGYLFFRPLGQAYFGAYESRALNETVAELAGRELGLRLAAAYGYEPEPAGRRAAPDAERGFDFRAEMRETRATLDALLAEGRIDEAERYLASRRETFVAAGYPIRKLNQAYFAFHGSYGGSPASVSPLEQQVRALRDQSGSLGQFLRHVSALTSPAALPVPAEPTGTTAREHRQPNSSIS
jgi:hypothetical protein